MGFKIAEIREILGEAYTDDIAAKLVELHRGVVDPLKDIIGRAITSCHFIGVIDESVSQRGYFLDLALDGEAFDDLFQVFHYFVF